MLPFIQPAEPDRLILGLTKEELLNPYPILQDHCDEYTGGEDRTRLQNLFEIGLVHEQYNNPKERMALLIWYKDTIRVFEAIHALANRRQSMSPRS